MTRTIPTGDALEQNRQAAILRFSGSRKVLSTGALNGGLRTDLAAVFNYNDCPRAGAHCQMQGDTLEDHQRHVAVSLGLNPDRTTGLNTGANIDNTAVHTVGCRDFSVTAVVTAGVEVNGCRVGTPAQLHETGGKTELISGTINILLAVDAGMTDACMTRALVTCTEAKVAALQELMVSDRYSSGLATGSGTDGTVIVARIDSPVLLREAGEHYKLGECIGKAVITAVKEALYRQSGLCPGLQHSVIRRLERFGITEQALWEDYRKAVQALIPRESFNNMIGQMSLDGTIVSLSSLYAHLLDQLSWDLLLPQEAAEAGNRLLELLNLHHGMPGGPHTQAFDDKAATADRMVAAFLQTVTRWVLGSIE